MLTAGRAIQFVYVDVAGFIGVVSHGPVALECAGVAGRRTNFNNYDSYTAH